MDRINRVPSHRSSTVSDLDDALFPVYSPSQYRPGPSLGRRPPPSPSPAPSYAPENIFADPADSPPPSPSGSAFYSSSIVTPTPSVRRPSLSLSSRREPSPLPGGGYYHHRLSHSNSLTPSIRSSSSSSHSNHGAPLGRSNTTATATTTYSTLSSIPSTLSDSTTSQAAPRWNYGTHQQNIYPESIDTRGSVPEEGEDEDPFADPYVADGGFVGDGFAPHRRPPPTVVFGRGSGGSSGGSVRSVEPPPYSKYPEQSAVKEVGGVGAVGAMGAPLRLQVSNGDSGIGIEVGRDEAEEAERRRRGGGIAPVGAVGLLAGDRGLGLGTGGGGEPDDGGGGHIKEWDEKRVMGFRKKTVLMGVAIAIMILLCVGLGVGLGVGLHHPQAATATATVYPTPTAEVPPTSEETGPPLSSPNDTFPLIPTGTALISPLSLLSSNPSCDLATTDPSTPSFFNMGASLLWSCSTPSDSNALTWRFERGPLNLTNMELYPSEPDFLRGDEYGEGAWGGYVVSSAEGISRWELDMDFKEVSASGETVEYPENDAWRDGTQHQAFWKIPFAFYNESDASGYNTNNNNNNGRKKRLGGRGMDERHGILPRGAHAFDDTYRFGILFNKTVVVKQATIDNNIARSDGVVEVGNGSALVPGEIVWKCVWEKTLLEVEVFADVPSKAAKNQKGTDSGDEEDEEDEDEEGGKDEEKEEEDEEKEESRQNSASTSISSTSEIKTPTPTPVAATNTSLTSHYTYSPLPTGCPYQPECPHYNGDSSFPHIPPPPPPSHSHSSDNFFGLKPQPHPTETADPPGNLTRRLQLKRQAVERSTPTSYPLKISIKESRPTSARIRRLLGMDLTDPDPKGRANLGEVRCTQYVVTAKGGLTPLVDPETGEGFVVLDEVATGTSSGSSSRLRERGDDSTCYCKWSS